MARKIKGAAYIFYSLGHSHNGSIRDSLVFFNTRRLEVFVVSRLTKFSFFSFLLPGIECYLKSIDSPGYWDVS